MVSIVSCVRYVALVLLVAAGAAVHAVDLDEAKRAGLVGETLEGYLAAVATSPTADVTALVEEVNAKRRAEYQRIARDNNLALDQVEALAAKKAIDKTAPGGWVRVNGDWRQK
jgi:uncharacterized protein YdbL (DUF1318 family)